MGLLTKEAALDFFSVRNRNKFKGSYKPLKKNKD